LSDQPKVQIIGISDDGLAGLTAGARALVDAADLLIGSETALGNLSDFKQPKIEIGGDLSEVIDAINDRQGENIVMIATGDPMFYGTARYLCDKLGKDRFEVHPHVSSMQLAFARVKESWDEAYLGDLSRQSIAQTAEKVRTAEKVGLFTSEENSPSAFASALLERNIDYFMAYVCENLGSPDERVTHAELSDIASQQFAPLNVMILIRKPDSPDRPVEMKGRRLFGNPDEAFLQSRPKRGLLTPSEVRTLALSQLDLGPSSTVWDVGAGSGAVAVEAAQISSAGRVFALEMDPEDYDLIAANAERFGVTNLTPVLGKAPEAWAELPAPDAIFVGGTGRTVSSIIDVAYDELRAGGRLVANVGSIENVAAIREVLRKKNAEISVLMVSLSRGVEQLERMRLESMHPTFLISTVKA